MKSFKKLINKMNIVNTLLVGLPLIVSSATLIISNDYFNTNKIIRDDINNNINVQCYYDNCILNLDYEDFKNNNIRLDITNKSNIELRINNVNNNNDDLESLTYNFNKATMNQHIDLPDVNNKVEVFKNLQKGYNVFLSTGISLLSFLLIVLLRAGVTRTENSIEKKNIYKINDEDTYNKNIDALVNAFNLFAKVKGHGDISILSGYLNNNIQDTQTEKFKFLNIKYKEKNLQYLEALATDGVFKSSNNLGYNEFNLNALNNLSNYISSLDKDYFIKSIEVFKRNKEIQLELFLSLLEKVDILLDKNEKLILLDKIINVIKDEKINDKIFENNKIIETINNLLVSKDIDMKQKILFNSILKEKLNYRLKVEYNLVQNKTLNKVEINNEILRFNNELNNNDIIDKIDELSIYKNTKENREIANLFFSNIDKISKNINLILSLGNEDQNTINSQFNTILVDVNNVVKTYYLHNKDEQEFLFKSISENLTIFNDKLTILANNKKESIKKNVMINKKLLVNYN